MREPTVAELPGLWETARMNSAKGLTLEQHGYDLALTDRASDLRAALAREAEREPTEAEVERVAIIVGNAFWADGNATAIARAAIIALRKGG